MHLERLDFTGLTYLAPFHISFLDRPEKEALDGNNNVTSILIGPNGTGKSLILGEIARATLKTKCSSTLKWYRNSEPSRVIAISLGLNDRFPHQRTSLTSRLTELKDDESLGLDADYLYFGASTTAGSLSLRVLINNIFDRISNRGQRTLNEKLVRRALDLCGFRSELGIKIKFRRDRWSKTAKKDSLLKIINAAIAGAGRKLTPEQTDLLRDPAVIKSLETVFQISTPDTESKRTAIITFNLSISEGYDAFQKRLRAIFVLRSLEILTIEHFSVAHKRIEGKTALAGAGFVDMTSLSSGELKRLCTLLAIAASIEWGSLILIDEPEISTHPNWQLDLVESIRETFSSVGDCHWIIATHSPYVVSSASPAHTIKLSKVGLKITAEDYPSTYGWPVEKILIDVFGIATTRNYYFEQRIRRLLDGIRSPKKNKTELTALITDLRRFVADDDDPLKTIINSAEFELGSEQ